MDELDGKLRKRLIALATAAERQQVRAAAPAEAVRSRARTRIAIPVGMAGVAGAIVVAILAIQLRPGVTPAATPSASGASSPSTACGGPEITWLVAAEATASPDPRRTAAAAFAAAFNAGCHGATLKIQTASSGSYADVLKAEIASGHAPDIVGPMGVRGLFTFRGELTDLAALITKYGPHYGEEVMPFTELFTVFQGQFGQVGIPYNFYPGYLLYDGALFAAAGLPEPPHKVGQLYDGRAWTWDELARIGRLLTIDRNGRNATQAGFDPNAIVQYGFDIGYSDARRFASCFGGGSLVAADGRSAEIPVAWSHAWNWYYDGMWHDYYARDGRESVLLGGTNPAPINGYTAMRLSWGWELGQLPDAKARGGSTVPLSTWDLAVLPSYGGETSSPVDLSSFSIPRASKNPDLAYQAMLLIMADPGLETVFGGQPARLVRQADYFARLNASLPGNTIDWAVLDEMARHPAVPSHEAGMPNLTQSLGIVDVFFQKLRTYRTLDVNPEIAQLRRDLQASFDAAPTPSP